MTGSCRSPQTQDLFPGCRQIHGRHANAGRTCRTFACRSHCGVSPAALLPACAVACSLGVALLINTATLRRGTSTERRRQRLLDDVRRNPFHSMYAVSTAASSPFGPSPDTATWLPDIQNVYETRHVVGFDRNKLSPTRGNMLVIVKLVYNTARKDTG
ncbi:hypothetical protein HPB49_009031 [Dermacentor silvarum]|uniref:Uncharacterized protein n=1 Tax=Dermacentor silvarum TaxID=543639 RepID=A0ACB8CKC7_DERSI|nr:hypothetical protein HPB49_009031 [Dermacentor silvarum]